MTFFKAATPIVKDTVIITDANGFEVTRFTACWHRPTKAVRKALLNKRLDVLRRLEKLQQSESDDEGKQVELDALGAETDGQIIAHLRDWEGLLDANDDHVEFSQDALKKALEWAEYAQPLIESLMRVASGNAVELAQVKNSVAPVGTGVTEPSAEVVI